MGNTKTVKFKFEARGGMRSEVLIKEFPADSSDDDIMDELKDWAFSLRSNSEYCHVSWEPVKEQF